MESSFHVAPVCVYVPAIHLTGHIGKDAGSRLFSLMLSTVLGNA